MTLPNPGVGIDCVQEPNGEDCWYVYVREKSAGGPSRTFYRDNGT